MIQICIKHFSNIRKRLIFSVIGSVKTGFIVNRLAGLSDDTVVVVGDQDGAYKLKQFNMKEKREIFSGELKNWPWGLTEITLGGNPAVALSYG